MKARPESKMAHQIIHDIGYTGHISAVLQKGQRQKEDKNIRKESQDASDPGNNTVHDQGADQRVRMESFQAV